MSDIRIEKLSKTYRGKKFARVEALKDLDLRVSAGEVFGFLGPNGAGKSTTIKILTGQIRPSSGAAEIQGKSVSQTESRQSVGYLPENPSFYDFLTAEEFLDLVGQSFSMEKSVRKREMERVLDLLNLSHTGKRKIRSFSKGMVQRLGIAQTLIHDPQVYILDEPMSGLDPLGRALVKEIIQDLKKRGKTVFFSTHITADVEAVCDRLGVIVNGRLRALDQVSILMAEGEPQHNIVALEKSGAIIEKEVGGHQLQATLETLWASEATVERIEPRRRSLEHYFLDVVAKAKNEG